MGRKIHKLAIANRGEVAVRIIRACQDLGIQSVLLHSEADVETLAFRLADEHVLIGPPETAKSYLNIDKNIQAALSVGADAIHPGFGFLSENAEFAEACENARIIFVGPSADSIRLFGDKISAKNLVQRAGGPVIPGYQGDDQSEETLIAKMKEIGFPVIVKATGGGGGRGLRVVKSIEGAREGIQSARREAGSAFGSEKVFLEKYLDHAKHIEFQIFGDSSGHVFNLYERECSVQRRHQKIIEEAPAAKLDHTIREKMAAVAKEIALTAKYRGAGTVEFLYQDGEFYFMEMNTRLQVEHPVTEMVYGVDLVKAQILTAQDQGLTWTQQDIRPRGHSIECRVYAENPYRMGLPSTGRIEYLHLPHGPGRRFECGIEAGDSVTPHYDPMIAKVIVWDETRHRAIRKMIETLRETVIFGVRTNIPYLIEILSHRDFVEGTMTTRFIETHFANGLTEPELPAEIKALAEQFKSGGVMHAGQTTSASSGATQADTLAPWFVGKK